MQTKIKAMYLTRAKFIFNGLFATKIPLLFFLLFTCNLKIDAQVVVNYSFTGAVQSFVVPCGVNSINVKAWGAGVVGG